MRIGYVIPVALVALAGARVARVAAEDAQTEGQVETPYAPSPTAATFVSLGYREAAADLFWVRLTGYFGGDKTTANGVAGLVDAILALDPEFTRAYEWGARAMTLAHFGVDQATYEHAIAVLQAGRAKLPRDYHLPYLEGQIYMQDLATTDAHQRHAWDDRAALLFETTSRLPGAPPELSSQVAIMRTRLGQHERAIKDLEETLALGGDNPRVRERVLQQLAELEQRDAAALRLELIEQQRKFITAWRAERPDLPQTMYVLLGKPLPATFDLADTAGGDLVGTDVVEPDEPIPRPVSLKKHALPITVALVVIAMHAPTLVFGRVDYDDLWLWADNSPLRHLDGSTLATVFFEFDRHLRWPLGGEYLPVRDVAVALDMALWGSFEQGPHITQLVLFIAVVLGLGRLLIRFGVDAKVAWLGVLLWALHPLHVQSEAWLSERKGVLAAAFVVVLGHAWVRYRDNRSAGWLVLAVVAAIAGTWSKAPAMFAVAAMFSWDVIWLPAHRRRWIAAIVVGVATAIAAAPVYLIATEAHVVGIAEAGGDRDGRVATSLGAQGHYIESLVLVAPPHLTYPINTDGPSPIELGLGAASVVGSIAAGVWCVRRKRGKLALALLAWAWVWFLPIGHVLVPVHIVVADRFALLWAIAGCVGAAWLVCRLPARVQLAAGGLLVVVLGAATIRAQAAWTSSVELYRDACDANPRDADMCEGLVNSAYNAGDVQLAFDSVERAIAARPDQAHLLVRKARLLADTGHLADALEVAHTAAATDAASAMSYYAVLLLRAGRAADALPWSERAARRHPELGDYQRTHTAVLVTLGRVREAVLFQAYACLFDPMPGDREQLVRLSARL